MLKFYLDDHVYSYLGAPASEAARRRAARQSRLKIQMFAESSSVAEELERNYSSLSDYDEDKEKEVCQVNFHFRIISGEYLCLMK